MKRRHSGAAASSIGGGTRNRFRQNRKPIPGSAHKQRGQPRNDKMTMIVPPSRAAVARIYRRGQAARSHFFPSPSGRGCPAGAGEGTHSRGVCNAPRSAALRVPEPSSGASRKRKGGVSRPFSRREKGTAIPNPSPFGRGCPAGAGEGTHARSVCNPPRSAALRVPEPSSGASRKRKGGVSRHLLPGEKGSAPSGTAGCKETAKTP